MTLERIKDAILSKAKEKAEEIKSSTRQDQQKRLDEAKERLEREFEEKSSHKRRQIDRDMERTIAHKRSQHNRQLLKKKNRILDRLFHQGARKLANLEDDEYRELIKNWLEEIPEKTAGKIICNEKDQNRVASLVNELNKARPEEAQISLKTAEYPEYGGVIYKAENFEIDLSIDSKLEEIRENMAPKIASMVFPEEAKL